MDLGDVTQLVLLATTALVFGRVGLALARLIERRSSAGSGVAAEAEDRLRTVEDECLSLRRELAELQERQDFTERALVQDAGRTRPAAPAPLPGRVVTPR
jgi:hypothetical protein